MTDTDFVSTATIARIRGCDRVTAWRWLKSLHPDQVTRRGRLLGLTRAQLEALVAPIDDRIERRLLDLEEETEIAEGRLNVLGREIREMKRALRGRK